MLKKKHLDQNVRIKNRHKYTHIYVTRQTSQPNEHKHTHNSIGLKQWNVTQRIKCDEHENTSKTKYTYKNSSIKIVIFFFCSLNTTEKFHFVNIK